MSVKPILCTGSVVCSLLDGRQTHDRRPLKNRGNPPEYRGGVGFENDPKCWGWENGETGNHIGIVPGAEYDDIWQGQFAMGDLLYVRETCFLDEQMDGVPTKEMSAYEPVGYTADDTLRELSCVMIARGKTRPCIHMPRWASRITLEVVRVWVERIQDISDEDCEDEGIIRRGGYHDWDCREPSNDFYEPECACGEVSYQETFSRLWNNLYEKRGFGWDVNPWVSCVEFKVHKINVDEFLKT